MKAVHAFDEAVDSLLGSRPNQRTLDRQHGGDRAHVFDGEISCADQSEHTAIRSGEMARRDGARGSSALARRDSPVDDRLARSGLLGHQHDHRALHRQASCGVAGDVGQELYDRKTLPLGARRHRQNRGV